MPPNPPFPPADPSVPDDLTEPEADFIDAWLEEHCRKLHKAFLDLGGTSVAASGTTEGAKAREILYLGFMWNCPWAKEASNAVWRVWSAWSRITREERLEIAQLVKDGAKPEDVPELFPEPEPQLPPGPDPVPWREAAQTRVSVVSPSGWRVEGVPLRQVLPWIPR